MGITAIKKTRATRALGGPSVREHHKKISGVFIAVTKLDDGEGIYSVSGPQGQTLPVVAIDSNGLVSLEEFARQQVLLTGRTVSIIGFTKRTHRHTFRPSATGDKK